MLHTEAFLEDVRHKFKKGFCTIDHIYDGELIGYFNYDYCPVEPEKEEDSKPSAQQSLKTTIESEIQMPSGSGPRRKLLGAVKKKQNNTDLPNQNINDKDVTKAEKEVIPVELEIKMPETAKRPPKKSSKKNDNLEIHMPEEPQRKTAINTTTENKQPQIPDGIKEPPKIPVKMEQAPQAPVSHIGGYATRTIDINDIIPENEQVKQKQEIVETVLNPQDIDMQIKQGCAATVWIKHKDGNFEFLNANKILLCSASKQSSISSISFSIKDSNGKEISKINSNFSRSLFYTVTTPPNSIELSSIDFKATQSNSNPNRQFTVTIPDGASFSASDQSTLAKASINVKKLIPKPPKFKGGVPVLRFGGKVKMESPKNFILIEQNKPENHLMICGKVKQDLYVAEIFDSVTLHQAVSIILPQFK